MRPAFAEAFDRAERVEWPEPDMGLLDANRRPAPTLPLKVFGPFWSRWTAAQAEAKSAPPDYVAAGLLSTASALIGNARWVSPWPGWKEPPTLWIADVGTPSSNKSPALDASLDLLRDLEAELNADFAERRRAHATAVEFARAARDAWQQAVRAAHKGGEAPPAMPAEAVEPEPLVRPRLLTNDATPEKLGRLLAANPRGLLYFRDELAGWLGAMDKYGGAGADRALWLEAYSGRPFVIDRVKDPDPIRVPRLAVALTGGIQPDRLASGLLAGDDDGLAARLLYVWPEPVPPRRPSRTADDAGARAALRRLLDLEMATTEGREPQPRIAPLEDGAAEALQQFREENARAEEGVAGMFLSWLGKMPGVACRLALVLEHLWWSGDRSREEPPEQVSRAAVLAAVGLIDAYLVPMAERAFGDAALPKAERNAATLARWIFRDRDALREAFRRAHGREPEDHELVVNIRQLQRRRLPGLRRADEIKAAVQELVAGGWLMPAQAREGGTAGRQRDDYMVSPRVWEVAR